MDAGWRLLKGQLREEASDPSTGSKNRTVIINPAETLSLGRRGEMVRRGQVGGGL